MKNILIYPQLIGQKSSPFNVARYLTAQLNKTLNVYSYPLFEGQCDYKSYPSVLIKTWANMHVDIAHFFISPSFRNGSLPFAFTSKITGIPTVLNIHGVISLEAQTKDVGISQFQHLKAKTRTSFASKAMTKIVVNSNFMVDNVAAGYGINPEKIVVIPNGVNVKLFERRTKEIFLEGDPVILYVGRLTRAKGVFTLIQALALTKSAYPAIKLHCVGASSETDLDLHHEIVSLGLEKTVVLHKWVPQSELSSYYKSADICVFPSQLESFGIVVLEAMASGVPLIVSNIPAFLEILKSEKSALFFKVNDANDLNQKILRLVSDSALRNQLKSAALKDVGSYDWEKISKDYLKLYHSITS